MVEVVVTRAIRAIIDDLSQSERRDSSATPKGGQGKRESARTFGEGSGHRQARQGQDKAVNESQKPWAARLWLTYHTVHEAGRAERNKAS